MYNPEDMSPGTLKEGEHELNPPHFGKTQTTNPDFENWHSPFNAHGCMSHLYPMEELKKEVCKAYISAYFQPIEEKTSILLSPVFESLGSQYHPCHACLLYTSPSPRD